MRKVKGTCVPSAMQALAIKTNLKSTQVENIKVEGRKVFQQASRERGIVLTDAT
jgi:hypothetical protein